MQVTANGPPSSLEQKGIIHGLRRRREWQKEVYKENEKLPAHGGHHSPYPKIRQIPDVIPLFTR